MQSLTNEAILKCGMNAEIEDSYLAAALRMPVLMRKGMELALLLDQSFRRNRH